MTKQVSAGTVRIGGGAPVSIQSMCNTDTRDVSATVAQILALEAAGCEIVRVAVFDQKAADAIAAIRPQIHIPLVADVHFDYRLAIRAVENGVDKLRINPGNIGDASRVRAVADCASAHHIPIRIGVNGGSLEPELRHKYGASTPQAMAESALKHVRILEHAAFFDIVLSLKASNVSDTFEAYREIAKRVDYPLHVGVTETGDAASGVVKSAIGIGALLIDGIGSTIRVSLTADPVEEVRAGLALLKAVGLRKAGVDIVSCPTCGRTSIDLIALANEVETRLLRVRKPLTVAVMGCVVNGPGESKHANIGISLPGNGERPAAPVYIDGEKVATLKGEGIAEDFIRLVDEYVVAHYATPETT